MGRPEHCQAGKYGESVPEPRRDDPEGDQRSGIFRQVRLGDYTPLYPTENLDRCGLRLWRYERWDRLGRRGYFAVLSRVDISIVFVVGCHGSQSFRQFRVSVGWGATNKLFLTLHCN